WDRSALSDFASSRSGTLTAARTRWTAAYLGRPAKLGTNEQPVVAAIGRRRAGRLGRRHPSRRLSKSQLWLPSRHGRNLRYRRLPRTLSRANVKDGGKA